MNHSNSAQWWSRYPAHLNANSFFLSSVGLRCVWCVYRCTDLSDDDAVFDSAVCSSRRHNPALTDFVSPVDYETRHDDETVHDEWIKGFGLFWLESVRCLLCRQVILRWLDKLVWKVSCGKTGICVISFEKVVLAKLYSPHSNITTVATGVSSAGRWWFLTEWSKNNPKELFCATDRVQQANTFHVCNVKGVYYAITQFWNTEMWITEPW